MIYPPFEEGNQLENDYYSHPILCQTAQEGN